MLSYRILLAPVAILVTAPLAAQVAPRFSEKRVPFEPGFRVYVISDMEGMASVVHNREIIAGNEGERYMGFTSPDYWDQYRLLHTQEMNSVIAATRQAGARSWVVNEGHGGNRFANLLPWELDPAAILIRGYPKPLVMITAIDSTFGTVMAIGAHANATSHAVMSHNFAFDSFTVNGRELNEVAINALIAGEEGVSVSLVSGDDVLVEETQRMLGNGVLGVVTKIAVGHNAAITFSPERVRALLAEAAREAVRRERAGDFEPFRLPRPYQVEFALRASYPAEYVSGVAGLTQFQLEQTGERSWRFVTDSARQIGYLLDAIESVVLP